MDVLALPRSAVDCSIRFLRLPLDTTMGVFDRDRGKASTITLAVDRADAAVRGFAGRVLHDSTLQRDAEARGVAVQERQRALALRTEAELRRLRADAELDNGLESAEQRRVEAEERAAEKLTRIDSERQAKTQRLAEETAQRKAASREAAAREEQAIEEREKKARLEQLENESQVLDAEETSLTAASEAQRLQRAAAEVKSKRKNVS